MYFFLAITILISFCFTYIIRVVALKKSILDNPNERSSHTVPTPRGGGLAIVIAFYLGLIYLFIQGKVENSLFHALLSGLPLMAVSIADDIISLSPKIRFATQFVSAGLALYFLGGLQILDLGFAQLEWVWILSPFALLGIIWFINLYNFIDGIDGYASMEAIFVGGALYFFTRSEIALVLAIATLGFLPWNWQRAKIFMGDVGSTVIGFNLVVLGIYFQNTGEFSLINWLMLTSLFWFDATYTLYRRWHNKEQLSVAHRKHAYQRIVQSGWSHQKTTLWGLGINLFLLVLVWVSHHLLFNPLLIIMVAIITLMLLNQLVDRHKPFEK
jgi:UDP-N-acetylmuramyl pentapeptide phosphotransferase/UDP-N-acetylglucosamine-1-phosphate transferase